MKVTWFILLGAFCATQVFAQEFESLKLEDKVVKNVRVTKSNPVEVTITYDGGGATIKRQQLPPELKAQFPYDEKEAAKYREEQAALQREKAADASAKHALQASAVRTALLRKEKELQQRLDSLRTEQSRIDKERVTQTNISKGKGARSPARRKSDQLRQEFNKVREEVWKVEDELKKVRSELLKQ